MRVLTVTHKPSVSHPDSQNGFPNLPRTIRRGGREKERGEREDHPTLGCLLRWGVEGALLNSSLHCCLCGSVRDTFNVRVVVNESWIRLFCRQWRLPGPSTMVLYSGWGPRCVCVCVCVCGRPSRVVRLIVRLKLDTCFHSISVERKVFELLPAVHTYSRCFWRVRVAS